MGTPYLSEIRIFSFAFAPKGWAFCNGNLLPINQNQALFALLGTTYGGDGQTNFALPDLRDRTPLHVGTDNTGTSYTLGQRAGESTVTLTLGQMPAHTHAASANGTASGQTSPAGNYWGNGGTVNIEDDWWGSNSGPASGDNVQTNPTGALAPTHWLVLSNSANPATINIGDTSMLTADFIHDNTGANVSAMDPDATHSFPAFIGLTVAYGAPVDGTLSNEQTTIQSGGTATATYTGTMNGNGSSSVTVDGVTATADIDVNNPAPVLDSITPSSATVGSPDTDITLTGTGFVNGSTADFNGTPLTTTFVSATQLEAVIPAAYLTTPGMESITVATAGPGGGTSAAQTLMVNNPPPQQVPPPFVSVAFGPHGEVIEVVNSAGVLTQFDASGAHVLGGGVRYASIAFGPNGAVLEIVSSAGILTQFDATGHYQQLGGAGVQSASVAFAGGEVLEVVLVDGSARQFSAAGVQELSTSGVVSVSVGFGPTGVVVEVLNTAGVLTQFTGADAQQLGGPGVKSADVAFTSTGEVLDIIFSDGTLDQFDAFGVHRLGIVP